MTDKAVMSDVQTLRTRARQHIERGAVTQAYRAEREAVVRMLNDALAGEIVCVLRYKRHQYMAVGIHARSIAQEFMEHAAQELAHADTLAARIVELGGAPDFSPDGLAARSRPEYIEGGSLQDMIRENLVAERVAVESYGEMVRYLGNDDPTTRRMIESILAMEEAHAQDLAGLLMGLTR